MDQFITGNATLFVVIVVIVAVVPTLAILAMVLRKLRNPRLRNGVQGTLTVTAAGAGGQAATYANTTVVGVINCPGLTPTPVEREIMAPSAKWPVAGQQLPVLVDPTDPTKFRILWDSVPTAIDVARQQAAAFAQRGGMPTPPSGAPQTTTTSSTTSTTADAVYSSVTVNGQPVSGTALDSNMIEAAMRGDVSGLMDALNGQGQPGTGIVGGFAGQDSNPQVLFDLMVTPDAGGAAFPATLVATFSPNSPRRAAWCQTGARIPVRFDPANPAQVQIDVGRV